MKPEAGQDRIRYSLSDSSGELCFEEFEIENASDCCETIEFVRGYLVGRPLANVDLGYLRRMGGGSNSSAEAQMQAVIEVLEECRALFAQRLGSG